MRILACAILCAGCTATQAQREACYARVEALATERAIRECKDTGWDACPARDGIRDELTQDRKECP